MANKIKTAAVLLKKQPYSESSSLIQFFTEKLGLISVLAKGLQRNKKGGAFLLNPLNTYEIVITDVPAGSLHILTEFTPLKEYPTDLPLSVWFAAQAGAEVLTKVLLSPEEAPNFYRSLQQYLDYIKEIKNNPVALFWRFLLHLYKLLGISLELNKCSVCQKEISAPDGYLIDTGRPLCRSCAYELEGVCLFNPETVYLLSVLPRIGNYLNDIVIERDAIIQIDDFLLNFLALQFRKTISLKSLQFFEQTSAS